MCGGSIFKRKCCKPRSPIVNEMGTMTGATGFCTPTSLQPFP